MKKLNIGCGPTHKNGWVNVDIQPFRSVDLVMDVTETWNFDGVDIVYAEHFIEHLSLKNGIRFLFNAAESLKVGGYLRLSTPNVEWVLKTHYDFASRSSSESAIQSTTRINRAFYGWGHQFLYSPALLERIMSEIGLVHIQFFRYGESDVVELQGIEEHGNYSMLDNQFSSVVIIQAQKESEVRYPIDLMAQLEESFIKYNESVG